MDRPKMQLLFSDTAKKRRGRNALWEKCCTYALDKEVDSCYNKNNRGDDAKITPTAVGRLIGRLPSIVAKWELQRWKLVASNYTQVSQSGCQQTAHFFIESESF